MNPPVLTQRLQGVQRSLDPFFDFYLRSPFLQVHEDPDACDFAFGNPHDMPLEGFTSALQEWLPPRHKDWFAYKTSEPEAQAAVAVSLQRRLGMAFEPQDIAITTGAFAGLMVTCGMVTEPGDEIIYNMPGWFFYEGIILQTGGTPVRVRTRADSHDLDVDTIAAAITPRTRAVIVNSPNNPSGRIYPTQTLRRLAEALTHASLRFGRTIYLISDEAYSQILLGGRSYASPTAHYPNSFLVYTYGKVLLTPGQRIGFIALPPQMAAREQWRSALFASQIISGWAFANAILQYALPQTMELSIDIAALERKVARIYEALTAMGYEVNMPEGTFYMCVHSPWEDDAAFCNLLMEEKVLCLPGSTMGMPGYFRLSLTANEAMVERAIPRFQRALEKAKNGKQ